MSAGNFVGSARVSREKDSPARTFDVAPKRTPIVSRSAAVSGELNRQHTRRVRYPIHEYARRR
jgi:hypothetical protein